LKSESNKYAASYYTAYNSLKKAAYNVLADMYNTTPRLSLPQAKIFV
jgi:hypothetical protein